MFAFFIVLGFILPFEVASFTFTRLTPLPPVGVKAITPEN